MYTDSEYRRAIVYTHAKLGSWHDNPTKLASALKIATKTYIYLCCPHCTSNLHPISQPTDNNDYDHHLFSLQDGVTVNSGLYGNLRHYRFFCTNEMIQSVRNKLTQLLEDHLSTLFRIASEWDRQGFSTLLNRAITTLIVLDRSPYHNAFSREYSYTKMLHSQFACLTSEEWITLIEQKNAIAQQNFLQWPLTHQLGFIPANCYSLPELDDGAYFPCDLISMGIISLALQEVILQFAKELGIRHCQDSKRAFLHQWHQVRATALLRAVSITMAAGAHIAEYKRSLLSTLPDPSSQLATNRDTAEYPKLTPALHPPPSPTGNSNRKTCQTPPDLPKRNLVLIASASVARPYSSRRPTSDQIQSANTPPPVDDALP